MYILKGHGFTLEVDDELPEMDATINLKRTGEVGTSVYKVTAIDRFLDQNKGYPIKEDRIPEVTIEPI